MKNILIITYYWPPSGGAAVQRWLSFANLLAAENNVYVLTVDEKKATFQLRDESLVNEVHPSIKVHSTKTREPFGIFTFIFGKKSIPKPAFSNEGNPSFVKKITRFVRGNLFIPDPRKGWKPFAMKAAERLIQNVKFDCVITAGPPHSTHFIGEALKQKHGLFWIADFHDLWTDVIYYNMLYHLPVVKKIDAGLEKRILESADLVLTVGEKYKQKLLLKSERLSPDKIKIVRIGYDEKLFPQKVVAAPQKEFVITYTGTMADYYRPQVFIESLKHTTQKFPGVSFRFRFAGVLAGSIRNEIDAAGLLSITEDMGYVPHEKAVQLLFSSTVLLLVNPVTKDEEMVIPGKLYEYLAAHKPIINITKQEAETSAIIAECKAGETFDRNQLAALTAYLEKLVLQWREKGAIDLSDNDSQVKQYSRSEIARHLQELIHSRS
ncbi:glycosyltransferase family 4 protein [Flavisolibacter ginsenosidimutans]|uniref:glycosyltransferase family 4 protein n=1 Tax=Flavisolibacter ginsenosidimutans TaxID=661481 RepID=UPI00155A894C|nr:glycosyltransferase family 4 protein [Flavisolibacter ginsenosidimutans]